MFESLIVLIAGFGCGFFSSAPIGPINLWIIERSIRGYNYRQISFFVGGVIFADVCLAAAATWGYFQFFQTVNFQNALAIGGGVVVAGMGLVIVLKRDQHAAVSPVKSETYNTRSKMTDFFAGLSLCGINPAFFTFWLVIVSSLSQNLNVRPTGGLALAFLTSIAVGDAVWFLALQRMVKKGVNLVRPETSHKIRLAIGCIFIAIGLAVIGQQIWQQLLSPQ